jgi:hypothetical protein
MRKRALERWGRKMKRLKKLEANSRGSFPSYWMPNVEFEYYQEFIHDNKIKNVLIQSSLMRKKTHFFILFESGFASDKVNSDLK